MFDDVWRNLILNTFLKKPLKKKLPWEAIDEKRDSLPAPQENFQSEKHENRQGAANAMHV